MSGRMRQAAGGDRTANASGNTTFADVLSRRSVLAGAGAASALALVGAVEAKSHAASLGFKEVSHGLDDKDYVPEGYERQLLIRWGDPVLAGAPAFDPVALTGEAQAKQFGYNCDFIGYLPLPLGSRASDHGLLGINHEYTNAELMFAGLKRGEGEKLTAEQVQVELAAHGFTVIEVKRNGGTWSVVSDGRYARRFPMNSAEFRIAGPAAGHARMKTSADPSGTKAIGTLNNCAGGVTPWGTFLTGEENFHFYFRGKAETTPEARNHRRYGVGGTRYAWGIHVDRFNIEKEPNEPNRFGWIVEIDPYDPKSVPVKRTALGRFKHEGANIAIAPDGRAVAYMGDDQIDEYVYRFVSNGRYDPKNRAANMRLLDEGTLAAARFEIDGTLTWLPLVFGKGPLTQANGFNSQADVVIEARRAADLMGATPMDRPEDVEPDPATGRIYAMCTGNRDRLKSNPANQRAPNLGGHVVEMIPPGGAGKAANHTADKFRWTVFLAGGDPKKPADGARFGDGTSENGWLSWPDNCAFDGKGRIWITTDGMPSANKLGDGLFVADILGPKRAATKRFYRAPAGAEVCGPTFTPDLTTVFLAIQHPAEGGNSTFEQPATRWPDFKDGMPPRPSVIAIVKRGGGAIGS
jgi:uncharacterized protein